MKFVRILVLLVVLGGVLFVYANKKKSIPLAETEIEIDLPAPTLPPQTPHPTPIPSGSVIAGRATYNYLCFLPYEYDKKEKSWPLILFLHGQRDKEDLNMLVNFGPIAFALSQEKFPFIIVAPTTGRGWNMRQLNGLLNVIERRYTIDSNRVYLTGMSMGGHATWLLAGAYPDRFAAIAPVCGAGEPRRIGRRMRRIAVWMFHGDRDEVVPVDRGLEMAYAMEKIGAEVSTTIYPNTGHDSWSKTYANPHLYMWFLKHQLGHSQAEENPAMNSTPIP
ncbi:MAG: phospholipase [Candidatus Omnitrophota bacterium]|jgi:predicted peptidase|nr:MAG: phospholipase [Candidatus Omnitrophota bacterium]